jgi:hypothetical protein
MYGRGRLAVVVVALSLIGWRSLQSQGLEPPSASESASTSHDYDLLVGSWNFQWLVKGKGRTTKGKWSFEREAGGLLVRDEFRLLDDSGKTSYLGVGYRVLNPVKKLWEIRYLDPHEGAWNEAVSWRDGADLRLQQREIDAAGKEQDRMRVRYYNISPTHFSWTGDRSVDGGATWVTDYYHAEAERIPSGAGVKGTGQE